MNGNNRISKVLTGKEITSVQQCLTTLKRELSFLQNLTPNGRKNLPKINSANKIFAGDRIHILRAGPQWIPGALTAEGARKDHLTLFEQLDPIILELEGQLRQL